jgi:hypothetical protein
MKIRLVTFIPAQDIEDAPVITSTKDLVAEVKQIEASGNLAVAYNEAGERISLDTYPYR